MPGSQVPGVLCFDVYPVAVRGVQPEKGAKGCAFVLTLKGDMQHANETVVLSAWCTVYLYMLCATRPVSHTLP